MIAGLLGQLDVDRFSVYAQDYGAPTQNGNGYTDGFVKAFRDGLFAYAENPTPENEASLREALTLELTRWQYLNGVADPSLVSPDS
ncbi:hypothetical protein [Streptomyces mirabilis]|uniref:hypothetical protein n=1 Tax=Streptomyces mirabilis TaxID=68239 RepID=UPI0033B02A8E